MRSNDAPHAASGVIDGGRPGVGTLRASPQVRASPQDGADTVRPTDTGINEFVSFAIGEDQYGVDIMSVREIREWSNVTRLPKQPDYMRGVLNLRGVMVPIIDLRCRFGQGFTETTPLHIIIVVQIEERLVGLLVDRVLDILTPAGTIQPVPKVAQSSRVGLLSGLVTINNNLIALVDLPSLLSDLSLSNAR